MVPPKEAKETGIAMRYLRQFDIQADRGGVRIDFDLATHQHRFFEHDAARHTFRCGCGAVVDGFGSVVQAPPSADPGVRSGREKLTV